MVASSGCDDGEEKPTVLTETCCEALGAVGKVAPDCALMGEVPAIPRRKIKLSLDCVNVSHLPGSQSESDVTPRHPKIALNKSHSSKLFRRIPDVLADVEILRYHPPYSSLAIERIRAINMITLHG
jgi:hypothetical protein